MLAQQACSQVATTTTTTKHDGEASTTHTLRLDAVSGFSEYTSIDVFVSSAHGHRAAFTGVGIAPNGCMSGPPRTTTLELPPPDQFQLTVTVCKPNGEQIGHAAGEPGQLQLSPTLSLCVALEPTTTTPHRATSNTQQQQSTQPSPEELRVAYELEQWRVAQERRFTLHLQQRTAKRLAELQAEWDAREQQRVAAIRNVHDRYAQLQHAAQALLADLQTREGHLVEAQGALQRATMQLEARAQEVEFEASRRVRHAHAESAQQQSQQSAALQSLQTRLTAAEQGRLEAEARCAALEHACTTLRADVQVRWFYNVFNRTLFFKECKAVTEGVVRHAVAEAISRLQSELRVAQSTCQQQAAALAEHETAREAVLQGVRKRVAVLRGGAHEGWHDVYRLVQERASLLESGAYSQESEVIQGLERAVLTLLHRLVGHHDVWASTTVV